MAIQLVAANYGYLYQKSLEESLRSIASHGFRALELTPLPPHTSSPPYNPYETRALKRLLSNLGIACISVNPSFTDLNLISTNTEFRELSYQQLAQNLELAHDLEASLLVVIPGRKNALIPVPDEDALPVLKAQLARLLERADALGITISLENSPYGFMQTAQEMLAIVRDLKHPRLKLTYDSANGYASENPAAGVTAVAEYLGLTHISDSWKGRWAHTQIGKGEIDFAAFAGALRSVGYKGATVYELVDGLDPDARFPVDIPVLAQYGWAV